jgi:hypothetical protein
MKFALNSRRSPVAEIDCPRDAIGRDGVHLSESRPRPAPVLAFGATAPTVLLSSNNSALSTSTPNTASLGGSAGWYLTLALSPGTFPLSA